MAEAPTSEEERLERKARLEEQVQELGVTPFWMRGLPGTPKIEEAQRPLILHWSSLYPLLLEAGAVVTMGEEAFRRAFGGYQIVMPEERAAAHRHAASAVRFAVLGDGLGYTTSNGEQMFMEPGDFLVQPSMTWHDHGNLGQEPVVWMDFLDGDVLKAMEATFRDEWPDGDFQPVTHTEGYHAGLYGNVRPARLVGAQLASIQDSPPVSYKWQDTLPMLERMAAEGEHDPYDGVLLEYANPVTGGHTLPTMCARLQLLAPGEETLPHRHTGFVRYNAVQGNGVTTLDLEDPTELEWGPRDIFRVPSWRWHRHRNASATEPAILFSISYSPLAETLGLYREEAGPTGG